MLRSSADAADARCRPARGTCLCCSDATAIGTAHSRTRPFIVAADSFRTSPRFCVRASRNKKAVTNHRTPETHADDQKTIPPRERTDRRSPTAGCRAVWRRAPNQRNPPPVAGWPSSTRFTLTCARPPLLNHATGRVGLRGDSAIPDVLSVALDPSPLLRPGAVLVRAILWLKFQASPPERSSLARRPSFCNAAWMRDLTVPTGMPRTSAVSAYLSP